MIKAATGADEPCTVTSLIDTLDLRQQAVTELVKRSIEAGLIAREASLHDKRVYHLRLTDEGEARLMCAFQALSNERASLAEAFDRLDVRFRTSSPSRRSTTRR